MKKLNSFMISFFVLLLTMILPVCTADTSFAATITASPSGNTYLSSITVNNGTLDPAFSKTVYLYTVTVPFNVEQLDFSYVTEDASSNAITNNPQLTQGETTDVTIYVSAQNGDQKTYVIKVAREKDPNYITGNNADLKSLVPEKGILSPVFDPKITEYVIYLPFEITTFNATGEMQDIKAQGASGNEIQLELGKNTFKITGKAEDGTEKIYTIIVNRMPASGSSAGTEAFTVPLYLAIIIALAAMMVGGIVGYFVRLIIKKALTK
ncbi:MAG: cadherin-like beta sandwich domain-containing protein [Saccharofermentanales bacterium]